ncbi:hypothetical protein GCM10009609_63660 [Pseudonocardia aurantiaca]|uniref:Uncharacterized protein n=1 Tax=Pseudonocardia aurantiaca TaxID=75290 RepID=A0ABW4FWI6_9PSEU
MRIGDKTNATTKAKTKTMAERAREQARHGLGVGRARLDEARARWRFAPGAGAHRSSD